jgi:hypothetical protein
MIRRPYKADPVGTNCIIHDLIHLAGAFFSFSIRLTAHCTASTTPSFAKHSPLHQLASHLSAGVTFIVHFLSFNVTPFASVTFRLGHLSTPRG